MTNKEIANAFDELANIMELCEEEDFRIKTYRNAYLNLRKIDRPLAELTPPELKAIKGVGDATAAKIRELVGTGKMQALEVFKTKVPEGVREMLHIGGFGPKKIRQVWKDLQVETIGELEYACNENRLVELKGFGAKSQQDILQKLEYYLRSKDKWRYDTAEEEAAFAVAYIAGKLPGAKVEVTGQLKRKNPVIDIIEVIIGYDGALEPLWEGAVMAPVGEQEGHQIKVKLENETTISLHHYSVEAFCSKQFLHSCDAAFLQAFVQQYKDLDFKNMPSEAAIFERAGLPMIAPELRDNPLYLQRALSNDLPNLVEVTDIKGILHVHTQYSDGAATLRDMCVYVRDQGFGYVGITDHSQSAFYANGLKPDRVLAQWAEIDALNAELAPFRIFKGIESDILYDGALDYTEDILKGFDFVIASVHSQLKMEKTKATDRLLQAIANPHTRILGHPTGRLLLSRSGYELEWSLILDACAKHGVTIELNANPNRLDIDYTLLPAALERGIKIAINPDAHSLRGVHDIRFGTYAARKGGLPKNACLNNLNTEEFADYCKNGKN